MKAYTDLEQSKRLSEILPIESADMWWSKNFIYYNPTAAIGISAEYSNVYTYKFGEDDIPCWSLATLLEQFEDTAGLAKEYELWFCYDNRKSSCTKHYDNPVDACVEMILKLHEQKLL